MVLIDGSLETINSASAVILLDQIGLCKLEIENLILFSLDVVDTMIDTVTDPVTYKNLLSLFICANLTS